MRSTPYSLGAALRVCRQCEARSPNRVWVLADRVTQDRAALGMQILARLDGVPATDSKGRIAHVRGIYLRAELSVTVAVDDPQASDAILAYQARSIFSAVSLRDVTGWEYLSDIDARTILDDQYFRWGGLVQWPPLQSGVQALGRQTGDPTADAGLAANVAPDDYTIDVSWYLPLVYPSKNPLRGLIPLPALQRVSNNALTIRIGQALAGPAPANVTLNGLVVTDLVNNTVREGCDIFLDIVYLDGLVVDAPWSLDEYTMTDLTGTLLAPDRVTEYAWIRHFPEDLAQADGRLLVNDYDGITVTVAGFAPSLQATLIDDAFELQGLDEMVRHTSTQGAQDRSNAAQSLPIFTAAGLGEALALLPYRDRRGAAGGPVQFRYATRGPTVANVDIPWSRYVHRTVACHAPDRAKRLEAALKCGPCAVYGTKADGEACNGVQSYEPAIAVPRRMSSGLRR